MYNRRSRTAPGLVSVVGLLLFAGGAAGHGHDMDKIEEGQYISADPIVRRLNTRVVRIQMLTGGYRTRYCGFIFCSRYWLLASYSRLEWCSV